MEVQYCMGCMRQIQPEERICPACGYRHGAEEHPTLALPLGTALHGGKYLTGRVLGQGGFGITYIGLDRALGLKVAIKEYFPSRIASRSGTSTSLVWHTSTASRDAGRESFVREARKMAKTHRISNVVDVRDVFFENETAYIVMDFLEGETLRDRLPKTGPLGMSECLALLRPVMRALQKAHAQGLVHRDISPDNIMLDTEGEVWLLDLGAAKELERGAQAGEQSSQMVVKHGFSPPEQSTVAGKIGPWTDVYAMCATICYCMTGILIPDAVDRMLGTPLRMPEKLPPALGEVLELGLVLQPEARIQNMGALLSALDAAERETLPQQPAGPAPAPPWQNPSSERRNAAPEQTPQPAPSWPAGGAVPPYAGRQETAQPAPKHGFPALLACRTTKDLFLRCLVFMAASCLCQIVTYLFSSTLGIILFSVLSACCMVLLTVAVFSFPPPETGKGIAGRLGLACLLSLVYMTLVGIISSVFISRTYSYQTMSEIHVLIWFGFGLALLVWFIRSVVACLRQRKRNRQAGRPGK